MFLLAPGVFSVHHSTNTSDQQLVSQVSTQIELPPGSDYFLHFDSMNMTLQQKSIDPYTKGLSDTACAAIAKSPTWIQRELTRQFHALDTPEPYAELLLNASKQYTDEIAFSIAYSPLGNVPSVDVLKDNARLLYENDKWIRYADIIDYDDGSGNYYSTIRYTVLENGIEKQIECPKEIYYWYVVHPDIANADAAMINGTFWRSYLLNHNDIGYPLLKEKLSTIDYLWDDESYYEPANRLWSQSIEQHPTAIEAISYWIGKTVPLGAFGDRPVQPNIIAHEHNGWCGELQRIAVAAQRTALIASVGACNVAEDHVWREFYERGWHENDNWWTDSGGAINEPDVYAYGWGKNMSSIYAWRGDDSISDLTSRYIHSEDRIIVRFLVTDGRSSPVDGARVTVMVKGLKDVTPITHGIWGKIQGFWDRIPQAFKGKLLQNLFNKTQTIYDKIPDVISSPISSTWNYTDMNGGCTFELGKNLEYLFVVQQGHLRKPWQLATHNTIRVLNDHADKTFQIVFPNLARQTPRYTLKQVPSGDYQIDVSFTTTAFQIQKHIRTDNQGRYTILGAVGVFLVDQKNFEKYQQGKRFVCLNYSQGEQGSFHLSIMKEDWYLIFRNHAQETTVIVDAEVDVKASSDTDHVQIVSPYTTLFSHPVFCVGDRINISGIATSSVSLSINATVIDLQLVDNRWYYAWNTSGLTPGDYLIDVDCGAVHDDLVITIIDLFPPDLVIEKPFSEEIVEGGILPIAGQSWDNAGVEQVDVAVDDLVFQKANGTTSWNILWDLNGLSLGVHTITAKAVDHLGQTSMQTVMFVVNESGHNWKPQINNLTCSPQTPSNTSAIVLYANVTTTNPFLIQHVILYYDNGTKLCSSSMYRYGDNPMQARHEEDSLQNASNAPLFGFEFGEFPSGTTVTYWAIASDMANNTQQSETHSFTVL